MPAELADLLIAGLTIVFAGVSLVLLAENARLAWRWWRGRVKS
jgi:hypothetical protein